MKINISVSSNLMFRRYLLSQVKACLAVNKEIQIILFVWYLNFLSCKLNKCAASFISASKRLRDSLVPLFRYSISVYIIFIFVKDRRWPAAGCKNRSFLVFFVLHILGNNFGKRVLYGH